MPKTATFHTSVPTTLEKFLGQYARIVSETSLSDNEHIPVKKLQVDFEGIGEPAEFGKLFFFPIDEKGCSIQLYYCLEPQKKDDHMLVYAITYLPAFFEQFPVEELKKEALFGRQSMQELQFGICAHSLRILNDIDSGSSISVFAAALSRAQRLTDLLARAFENIAVPFSVCQVPACRFLANDLERDKIQQAILLIEQQVGKPNTIKELARKVAMNECYLKKGFKAITGKTIHEYQQEIRIIKAKELLTEHAYTVTSVSEELGYSSIAHFSTAFKRLTGLKPCDLIR